MGCYNHKGNFSQLPIRYGDRAVAIIGITSLDSPNDIFAPGESFTPISVPIRGTYNDKCLEVANAKKTESNKE